MERELIEFVRERGHFRCEYCHFPEQFAGLNFQIDHIIAEKHRGKTESENLALSCIYCNSYKGPNLSGIDHGIGTIERLFHPRRDRWEDHFEWNGPVLIGRTGIGRATIDVLRMNEPQIVSLRRLLKLAGVFSD